MIEIIVDLICAVGFFQLTEWASKVPLPFMGVFGFMPVRIIVMVVLTLVVAKNTIITLVKNK